MGIRELSAATGFPPPTTHRIVSALVQRGYLQKNGLPPRYALSPKFLLLAEGIRPRSEVALIARPYLENLVQLTGENANLCIQDGMSATYIDHIRSRKHNLRIRVGGEKGGLVCMGGVCREEEPFRGIKVVLTSIF